MRAVLLAFIAMAMAQPLSAQASASVHVEARVTVPDFMGIRPGEARDSIQADGTHVRRVTVYVSANRMWKLRVIKQGAVVKTLRGGRGSDVPVVVELPWREPDEQPDPARIEYQLTGA